MSLSIAMEPYLPFESPEMVQEAVEPLSTSEDVSVPETELFEPMASPMALKPASVTLSVASSRVLVITGSSFVPSIRIINGCSKTVSNIELLIAPVVVTVRTNLSSST